MFILDVSHYPITKHYALLIVYHLNDLNLSSFPVFFQKPPPCSCYGIFKFPTKPVTIVSSQIIKSSEKDLNRWK